MNDQAMGNIEKSKKNKKRKYHESEAKDSEDTNSCLKKKKQSDHETVNFDTGTSLPKASFTEAIEEFSEKDKGGKRKKHKKKRSLKDNECSEIEQTQKGESCGKLKPQGHDIDASVACDENDSLRKSKKAKKHRKKKEGKEHVVESEVLLGHDKNRDKVLCANEIVKHGSSQEDKCVERSGEKEAKKKNETEINKGGEESEILVSDKKRKKKKKNEIDNNVDCGENHVLVSDKNKTKIDGNDEVNKVFGKKAKKKYESENNVDCEESKILMHNSKQKKKKKKKKKKSDFESCGEYKCEKNPELGSDKKKKKKKKGQNHEDLTFEKTELGDKSDKTKNKYISNDISELKLSHAEEPTQSDSGKKKKHKEKQNENINAVSEEEQNAEQQSVSKKSKSEAAESISSNHSSKTVAAASVDTLVDANQLTTGQWQGDLFHDADRQNKFLRLLGGRKKDTSAGGAFKSSKLFKDNSAATKKGLFGSLAPRVGGGNALSLSDAARLNERLEEDYNKALNLRLNTKKGTGFGFVPDPAEGKKFHIDINKTKSIKFDD